jgi:hypothetical protein
MNASPLDPEFELQAISKALIFSEEIIRKGGSVDLTGVDSQVEKLCAEVVKTEGPLRLKLLPMLENVIHVLDRLEASLRQTAEFALHNHDENDKRLRAHNAYGMKDVSREQGAP